MGLDKYAFIFWSYFLSSFSLVFLSTLPQIPFFSLLKPFCCLGYIFLLAETKYLLSKRKEGNIYLVESIWEASVHSHLVPKQGAVATGQPFMVQQVSKATRTKREEHASFPSPYCKQISCPWEDAAFTLPIPALDNKPITNTELNHL